ncbi:MAG: hypothetical protein IJ371_01270 [Clostridia bacterium]|nr:hypothetical protein [Clostridia bacterium]
MEIKQIAKMLNDIYGEVTGETGQLLEDLTGVGTEGVTLQNFGETILTNGVDNYVKSLINKIGRIVNWDREYKSTAPKILKDSFEFGSILEKVRVEVDDFVENDSWKLVKGQSYDPFIFNPPSAQVKIFNGKSTYELDISITEMQVKESFRNATELNRFIAMIENRVKTKLTLANDFLAQRTINNLIGEKIHANKNVVNILSMYNAQNPSEQLTATNALSNPNFIRYAILIIAQYSDLLKEISVIYNNDGYATFTPKEKQHFILLSLFDNMVKIYLQSDTYHKELVELNGYDTVPYWQAVDKSEPTSFDKLSTINIKTWNGNEVNKSGIIGVIFDENACAIANENYRVTSQWVAKGEFWNYFYKFDAMYLNDLAENCVVFVVAD